MADKIKSYFLDVKLKDGRYVTLVYNSGHAKNALDHSIELQHQIEQYEKKHRVAVDIDRDAYWTSNGRYRGRKRYRNTMMEYCYIMNKKNMDEQCFGEDHEVIDLRS